MSDFTEQELQEIIGICKTESKLMDVLEGMAPVSGEQFRINLSTISLKAKQMLGALQRSKAAPAAPKLVEG